MSLRGISTAQILETLAEPIDVRTSKSGKSYAKALVEVRSGQKSGTGKWEENVTILPVMLFGRSAEIADQYLKVSDAVYLICKVQGEAFKRSDGAKRYGLSLIVDNLHLLPSNHLVASEGTERKATPAGPRDTAAKNPKTRQPQPRREPMLNEFGEPDDIPF
jgi:single-strand DNA-binding protein